MFRRLVALVVALAVVAGMALGQHRVARVDNAVSPVGSVYGSAERAAVADVTPATGRVRDVAWQTTIFTGTASGCDAPTPASMLGTGRVTFDGQPLGMVGTRGLATRTETGLRFSGGSVDYAQTTAGYDALGRPTAVSIYSNGTTGARTSTTSYSPSSGPVSSVTTTNPLGHDTLTSLNLRGQPITVTTALDQVKQTSTRIGYDPLGRTSWVRAPDLDDQGAPSVAYAYQTASTTSRNSITTTTRVDTSQTASTALVAVQILDGFGRVLQTRTTADPIPDATGAGTRTIHLVAGGHYDTQGRPVRTDQWVADGQPGTGLLVTPTSPGAGLRSTTTSYDPQGRVLLTSQLLDAAPISTTRQIPDATTSTTITGLTADGTGTPQGATTRTTVDNLGRVTLLQQATTRPTVTATGIGTVQWRDTSYSYDPAGRRTGMVSPKAVPSQPASWAWTFDLAGRVTSVADPDAGVTATTYLDTGEVATVTDARGGDGFVRFDYDAVGRRTARYTTASGAVPDTRWW